MLFVCGVHGARKTDFANELCKELSLKNYSVRGLIQNKIGQFVSDDNGVKAALEDPRLLIEAIGEMKEFNYILEGNLCLINSDNKVERVSFEVFSKMHMESLYIIIDRPQQICKRLQNKDKKKWDKKFMKEFQEEEILYASELAHKLSIPLNIIYANKRIDSFSVVEDDNIILPIKPLYADKILNGEKKYEYRKKLCQKDVGKIYIYATAPIKKIIGEAEVVQKLEMNKSDLWDMTKKYSGISRKFYDSYFANQSCACAYQIGKIKRYRKPLTLESLGIEYVPQSFVYYGELKQ